MEFYRLTGSQKDSEINATQFNTKHSPLVLSLIAEELKIKGNTSKNYFSNSFFVIF